MNIRHRLATVISAALITAMSTPTLAGTRPFMTRGEVVAAPPGFSDLCERDAVDCGAMDVVATVVTASAATFLTTSSLTKGRLSIMGSIRANALDVRASQGVIDVETLQPFTPAPVEDFLPAGARLSADAAPQAADVAVQTALLDKSQLKLVEKINRSVNRDVHKASDFDLYGLLEFWSLPRVIDGKMYGDCEDYALEKRRRLIAAGVPARALSMAVAITSSGEGHAVLVVAFESGDMVLDNLSPWATPWEDLNYRWVQRQIAGSSAWTTVS